MEKEEALKILRDLHDKSLFSIRTALETLIPELRESEDERALRIIKKRMCYDPVPISDEDRRIVENWLEKQKEQKPENVNPVLECDKETDVQKAYREGRNFGMEMVRNHPEEYGLQKEQKHPDGCFTCDEYKKGYEAGRLNGFTAGYNKAMKEQKLAELNGNETSIAVKNPEAYKIGFADGEAYAKEQGVPAEWSEEDKENSDMICEIIDHCITIPYIGRTLHLSEERKEELKTFIKSLRPSWKPSEEQMEALRRAVNKLAKTDVADSVRLSIMYDNFKKLM